MLGRNSAAILLMVLMVTSIRLIVSFIFALIAWRCDYSSAALWHAVSLSYSGIDVYPAKLSVVSDDLTEVPLAVSGDFAKESSPLRQARKTRWKVSKALQLYCDGCRSGCRLCSSQFGSRNVEADETFVV